MLSARAAASVSSAALRVACAAARSASSSAKKTGGFSVAVAGAAGGIGQPLSLLLKSNPLIRELRLYDVSPATPGVAADLSHIPTRARVLGFAGKESVKEAFANVDCIVIPAGVPRKPGMTRDDLFNTNASIVASLADAAAQVAPNAFIAVISNPVNSTVPIVAERLKKAGVFSPRKIFGVTTLDVLRANTFLAENQNMDPTQLDVPVYGGHAGTTIVPIISQQRGTAGITAEEIKALTHRIQFGGDEVVKAKAGAGSATLSMAAAGARFVDSLLRGAAGERDVIECAFVQSSVTAASFFSSRVTLGPTGAEMVHGLGKLSAFEQAAVDAMLPDLIAQIKKGIEFAQNMK